MEFDIFVYLNSLRKWIWLMVISAVIAGGTSYVITRAQPDIYKTQATMVIGQAINDPNPTSSQISLEKQLADTYVSIAMMNMIRTSTMESLEIEWLPDYRAYSVPNSQLIQIEVTDTNPERAQIVANELARQLIINSPANSSEDEQERIQFIENQLDYFEEQIQQTQKDIADITEAVGTYVNANQINQAQLQLAALELKLTTLQATYAELLPNTQSEALNIISVVEPASLPVVPVGPNRMLLTISAAAGGLLIAVFGALLMERLSTTLETHDDITSIVDKPIIGVIPDLKQKNVYEYLSENPGAQEAENFRTLRTNIHFMNINEPFKTIMVSSPNIGDGKTSLAINLAFIEAQTQKRVVLVDADLRNPDVYKIIQDDNENTPGLLENTDIDWDVFVPFQRGISDVFLGMSTVQEAVVQYKDTSLYILPSGTPPPNPAELISSEKMLEIIEILKRRFDLIIFDAPPFLVTDAAILSSMMDAVIGVVVPGKTKEPGIISMKEQISRVGGNLIGLVMNRTEARLGGQYSTTGYGYYPTAQKKTTSLLSRFLRRFSNSNDDILIE